MALRVRGVHPPTPKSSMAADIPSINPADLTPSQRTSEVVLLVGSVEGIEPIRFVAGSARLSIVLGGSTGVCHVEFRGNVAYRASKINVGVCECIMWGR